MEGYVCISRHEANSRRNMNAVERGRQVVENVRWYVLVRC
jgi:hypothetical protein